MDEELSSSKQPLTLGRAFYAVLLAFLSVGGVASAWMYQWGRASYFKIPKSLIRIEVSEVGMALLYLAPCLVPILFAPLIGSAGKKSRYWIALPCLALFGFAADACVHGEIGIAGGLAWSAAVVLVSACLEQPLLQSTSGSGVTPWLGGLTLFSMVVSGTLGSINARTQRDFYVIAGDEIDYVVLALYGDRLVLAPLSPDNNTIEPRVEVRSLDKDPVLTQRWRLPKLMVTDFVEVDAKLRAELRAQRAAQAALSTLKP